MVVRLCDDDRGQLLISGAVVIAITMIAVVSLYSTAISPGSSDSRTAIDAATDAQIHRQIVEEDLSELADRGSCSDTEVGEYTEQYNRIHATSEAASISIDTSYSPDVFLFVYESPEIHYTTEISCSV